MAEDSEVARTPSGRLEPQPRGRLGRWLRLKQYEAERRWADPREHFRHKRLLAKVVLLHVRYTCGYLATGFLISAPIQLGTQDHWDSIGKSLVLGLICTLPFVVLWPFTRVDWERMRLPEFKNLELAQTRWAVYASGAFLLVCGLARLWPDGSLLWLFDVRIAWLSLLLMAFAWLRVKFHTLVFREFYTLKPDDDLVLSYRPPLRDTEPEPAPEPAAPAPEALAEVPVLEDPNAPTDDAPQDAAPLDPNAPAVEADPEPAEGERVA
ncbi:MAG: hypothetical protein R3F62_12550 [Planctomycetota bacterium]